MKNAVIVWLIRLKVTARLEFQSGSYFLYSPSYAVGEKENPRL